jgi:hypothetical protein
MLATRTAFELLYYREFVLFYYIVISGGLAQLLLDGYQTLSLEVRRPESEANSSLASDE